MSSGCAIAWHRDPSNASSASRIACKFVAPIVIANTAWLAENIHRSPQYEFAALKYVFSGGDSVTEEFLEAWEEMFQDPLLEGYDCAEMAPVIAANVPDYLEGHGKQAGTIAGSVGHPIPEVSVKVVDRATNMPMPTGEPGLLLAKDPNLLLGYLNDPEATAAVFRDGWFSTGDTAVVDQSGFFRIMVRR